MFGKWAYIPALLASFVMPLAARDIFVTPAADSASTTIGVFKADPLASTGTITGPAGAFQVLRAGATKFYIISRTAADAVTVYEGTPPALTQTRRFNLSEPATAAAVSPDGKRVVVIATSSVYIFDTATDTNLTSTGVIAGANPTSLAFSQDSSRVFVLSPASQRVTAVDTNSGTLAGTVTTPGTPVQVAAGPNGFLYVTAPNSLLEYDPRTLLSTGTTSLNAFPSSMGFTPDGKSAVLVNSSPVTGSSLIHVDLIRRTFVIAPPIGNNAVLEKVVVTDNNTAYTLSRQTGRIYTTRLTPGGTSPLTLTPVTFPNITLEQITDIAPSTEVSPHFLLITTPIGLFRADAPTAAMTGPVQSTVVGNLSVNAAPVTSGATTTVALNDVQTIQATQTSLPLVIQVSDSSGNPVSALPVAFTANVTGSTFVNVMSVTNNQGIAVAYVNPPAATTSATITVTATPTGAPPASFTVNVGTSGGGGSTSGLQIVSGNGQAGANFTPLAPLVVMARDATGKPLTGVNVTWTVTQGSGGISPAVSVTDEKGQASANFVSSLVTGGARYQTNIVTASTGVDTTSLYATTLANFGSGAPGFLQTFPRTPTVDVIQGNAGQTIVGALKFEIVESGGQRVPFIGVRLETTQVDSAGNPVVSCRGGTTLSDTDGVAICDLVLGNFVGEVQFIPNVGGNSLSGFVYTAKIIPAAAGSATVVQGNGQSGNPGQQLPVALVAEFRDTFNNLAANAPVQWEVLSGGAVLSAVSPTTDVNGKASATVTLGPNPGPAQIRVRSGATATAVFNVTANIPASAIQKQPGGDNQSAAVGQAFAQPLSVLVLNAQQQPITGAQITFSVATGSTGTVTLGSPTATSNAQGIASTTVTAGTTIGAVTVRASIGTLAENFTLTVRGPGPVFTANSIVNAAGFQPGISPGSLAVINASGIAPGTNGTVTPPNVIGPLPLQLAGVEVFFNNTLAAPILYVSNINGRESVSVQVPFEVTPGTASVTIRVTNGGSTTVSNVPILALKPGVFESVDPSGLRYATATRPDGSYVSPTNPARRGEIIRVFVTGLGQTAPATGTNRTGSFDLSQMVLAPVIVGVNNEGVRVVTAQLSPGSIGVYYVAFEVPLETTRGNAPFAVAVVGNDGTTVFGNGTTLPIF